MSIRKAAAAIGKSNNRMIVFIRHTITQSSFFQKKCVDYLYHSKMDDREYIAMKYKELFGVEPNLDNPTNFNEKSNWRKLYDRQPIYTDMVDKYKVKKIIGERCGEDRTFKLLGVWDKPEQINFDTLPEQFVLKTNHAGGVLICRDRRTFDKKKAIRSLNKLLKVNYYIRSREWPYKNVRKKIIAEEYKGENLVDYKNYCFNGRMLYTFVWQNHSRNDGTKPDAHFCGAYDRNWVKTDLELDYPSDDIVIEKPKGYEDMVRVAEKMSKDIPFVRVDCYLIDGNAYIGEMTFFPWGGFQKFKDEHWNEYLGKIEKLPGIDY